MTHRKRVVVTDHNFRDLRHERAAAESGGALFEERRCATAAEVREAIAGADVAVVQFAPVDAQAIAGLAPGARLIRYGVGYDNIDVEAARSRDMDVAYVPDYCVDEVADHTATLLLSLARRMPALDADVRRGGWSVLAAAPDIRSPRDLVVGFLGLGRIGRATLARLAPFGFGFAVSDPALPESDAAAIGARRLSVEELIASADMLVLHLPLTAATKHIIDAAALARMKKGSVIVNTARGGLIDEAALADALNGGHLAGAGLDVFETEPLEAASPLRAARGALLTPHAAWYSDTALDRLQGMVADEIGRALRGQPPRCPVPR